MPDVKVTVAADGSAVNSGLKTAKDAVQGFKETTKSAFGELKSEIAGFFVVDKLKESIMGIIEEFSHIQDLSEKFGESAESIQRVGHVAKLAGTDIDTVGKAMQKVNGNAINAIQGNENLQDSFAALGINAKKFIDLPMESKLVLLAKGFEEGGSQGEKMDAIVNILGKSGTDLIPLFTDGAAALKNLFAQAQVSSNETVKKLDEAGDKISATWSNIKASGATALAFLIDRTKELWGGLNSIGVYLANLPDGFKAASKAVDDFQKDFMKSLKGDDAPAKVKKKTNVDAIEERAKTKERAKEEADAKKEAEREAAREEKERQRDEERDNKDWAKRMAQILKDADKQVLQSRKDVVASDKDLLKDAEGAAKRAAIPVDQLRRVGGGISKSELSAVSEQVSLQRQHVSVARENLRVSKEMLDELVKQSGPVFGNGDDGIEG